MPNLTWYDKLRQKSKPEYGIRYNKKNALVLEPYWAETFFSRVMSDGNAVN